MSIFPEPGGSPLKVDFGAHLQACARTLWRVLPLERTAALRPGRVVVWGLEDFNILYYCSTTGSGGSG